MSLFFDCPVPREENVLVAFADLTGFVSISNKLSDPEMFSLMASYFQMVASEMDECGGRLIKCMGDAALILFPENLAEAGILALMDLRPKAEEFMKSRGFPSRLKIGIHFTSAILGDVHGRLDVYGKGINTAAILEGKGVALTPQAFRQLSDEGRKLFKKHTPSVYYIPLELKHDKD